MNWLILRSQSLPGRVRTSIRLRAIPLEKLQNGLPENLPCGSMVRLTMINGWVHVDLAAGRIVSVMDSSRRAYAWLYYGLHTFSFPFFANHPSLRRTVMLIFLSAGLVLSLSGVVVGFRRMGKSLPFFGSPVRSRRAVSGDSGSYRPSAW
jgi:hypothetical protein